jgi:hypothetical protein
MDIKIENKKMKNEKWKDGIVLEVIVYISFIAEYNPYSNFSNSIVPAHHLTKSFADPNSVQAMQ